MQSHPGKAIKIDIVPEGNIRLVQILVDRVEKCYEKFSRIVLAIVRKKWILIANRSFHVIRRDRPTARAKHSTEESTVSVENGTARTERVLCVAVPGNAFVALQEPGKRRNPEENLKC
jgi:hypothetical protein